MNTRQYESVVIINAALEDEEIKKVLDSIKSNLTNLGGEIINIDDWGRKRLAYPIAKSKSGYYIVYRYLALPEMISPLERTFRLDENIIRFLTIQLDKKALDYYAKVDSERTYETENVENKTIESEAEAISETEPVNTVNDAVEAISETEPVNTVNDVVEAISETEPVNILDDAVEAISETEPVNIVDDAVEAISETEEHVKSLDTDEKEVSETTEEIKTPIEEEKVSDTEISSEPDNNDKPKNE